MRFIKDVFPVVHLHVTRITDSKRGGVTVAELCRPKVLEVLSEEGADGERSARLRFTCHVSKGIDTFSIAIRGTLDREGKFSPMPVYLKKILRGETSLITGPTAQTIAMVIHCQAPGDTAVIWYGYGGAIWSAEHGNRDEKFADIVNAVTNILNSPLTVIDAQTGKKIEA